MGSCERLIGGTLAFQEEASGGYSSRTLMETSKLSKYAHQPCNIDGNPAYPQIYLFAMSFPPPKQVRRTVVELLAIVATSGSRSATHLALSHERLRLRMLGGQLGYLNP